MFSRSRTGLYKQNLLLNKRRNAVDHLCVFFFSDKCLLLEALFRLAMAQAAFSSGPISSELEESKSCSPESISIFEDAFKCIFEFVNSAT